MPIAAGTLDRFVRLERRSVTEDPYGGEVETWSTLADRRASVRFGTGQERREAAQEGSTLAATFRLRRDPATATLNTTDRLRFDALDGGADPASAPAWDIVSVVPFERDAIDIVATRSE